MSSSKKAISQSDSQNGKSVAPEPKIPKRIQNFLRFLDRAERKAGEFDALNIAEPLKDEMRRSIELFPPALMELPESHDPINASVSRVRASRLLAAAFSKLSASTQKMFEMRAAGAVPQSTYEKLGLGIKSSRRLSSKTLVRIMDELEFIALKSMVPGLGALVRLDECHIPKAPALSGDVELYVAYGLAHSIGINIAIVELSLKTEHRDDLRECIRILSEAPRC